MVRASPKFSVPCWTFVSEQGEDMTEEEREMARERRENERELMDR